MALGYTVHLEMAKFSQTILRLEYMDASCLTLLIMEIIPMIDITLFQVHNLNDMSLMLNHIELEEDLLANILPVALLIMIFY